MASNPDKNWQDRRGMFQKGKELHSPTSPTARKFSETGVTQAVRRASTSSNGGSPVDTKTGGGGGVFPVAAASGRRRSSAGSGLFGSLQAAKRGSEDYGERRTSQTEMQGGGGIMSGWFNSTFKGVQKPADNQNKDSKRGVME